jgi:hypothetical protein
MDSLLFVPTIKIELTILSPGGEERRIPVSDIPSHLGRKPRRGLVILGHISMLVHHKSFLQDKYESDIPR